MIFSGEIRFPLLPIQYLDLNSSYLMVGQYSRDLPFGVSAAVFYDVGMIGYRKNRDSLDILSGFGVGLHFHLPYVELLRIEYAFDWEVNGQIIIDTKVAL